DRTTNSPRDVVVAVAWRIAALRFPFCTLAPAIPRIGVERLVTLVVRAAAVELAAAALGDDGDAGTRTPAVLGLEVRRLHLDFGNRVEGRGRVVARVRARVLADDAVVGEVERGLPVDRHTADRSPAGGLAVARVDDAGQQLERAHEVASLQTEVGHLRGRDRRGSF